MRLKRLVFYSAVTALLLLSLAALVLQPFGVTMTANGSIVSLRMAESNTVADIPGWLQEYEYREPFTTEIEPNKYEINYGGEIVQVGKGTAAFSPDVTLYRWDKECYLTIGEPMINDTVISQKNPGTTLTVNAIGWDSNGLGFKFYPKTQTEQNEYGSFEYEITLVDSKAGTGELLREITFPIHSSGLEFYYQPELTQKEIDDGAYRPDNVVGSYAVYHASKKNHVIGQVNYGAGKAFHIYRPMLIDNKGAKVYADLIITENSLTIDLSPVSEWLTKADYPVVIDPEFGYTGAGGSYDTWATNDWVGLLTTSPADAATGTDWKIYQSAKMHSAGATGNCKGTIHDTGKNMVANGVGGVSTQITSTKAWVYSSYSTAPEVANSTSYYIGVVVGNPSSGYFDLYYDATGAGKYDTNVSGGYASPGNIDPSNRDRNHSVYATYTSGSTLDLSITPLSRAFGTLYNSQTYYSNNLTLGYAPSWPLADVECYFTATNGGTASGNVTVSATNFTGGITVNLTDDAPGADTIRLSLYRSGDGSTDNTTLSTSPRTFKLNLGPSTSIKWEIKIETPTSDQIDSVQKTCTITFNISSP